MPPPVVYVAAIAGVVVTFAAAMAFKEFVYAPHIAPTVDAWKEAVAERRRRERARRQGPIPVPVMAQSALNERPPTPNTRATSPSPIELHDFRSDATEWRSPGTDNNLRHRRGRTSNVLDESNVFVPYDPISPTPLSSTSAASSPGPSGSAALPSPPIIHSPLPTTAINASRLQQSISAQSLEPSSSSITSSRSPSSSATQRSPSPAHSDLASSMSTASSFTPAVIGPASSPRYGTPSTASVTSDTVRSVTLDAQSPPASYRGSPPTSPFVDATRSPFSLQGNHSAPMSPFSDVNAVDARSPFGHPLAPNYPRSPSPVFLSPPQSSLNIASESDFAILSPSLRSGMLSPDMSVVDEDVFDIDDFSSSDSDSGGSDGGRSSTQRSDDWTSVGRRTPSPTNYTRHFE